MGRKLRLAYRKKNQKSQEGCSSTLPVVSLPVVSLPVVSLPVVSLPVVSLPVVYLPVVSLPVVSLPVVSLPVVSLPVVTDAGNILNIYGYHRFMLLLIVSSLQFSST